MALIRRGLVMIDYLARLGTKNTYKAKFEALCAAIDNAPAVDAVEVVRRKDCVYACDRPPFPTTSKLKADCWCAINDHLMSLDDFCSRGETAAMKDSRDAAEQDAHEQLCSLGNPEDGSL